MIRRVNALHRFNEENQEVQAKLCVHTCGDYRKLDQDMIGVGRNVKLANILRFVAGKVRPLGLEGLGTKVKEVFEESEVS